MIKLSKTLDCQMNLLKKLKRRFFGENIIITVDANDLAWYMQMGWVEKSCGKYIMTEYGIDALGHVLLAKKEKHGY
jgi:hypothetical protein